MNEESFAYALLYMIGIGTIVGLLAAALFKWTGKSLK